MDEDAGLLLHDENTFFYRFSCCLFAGCLCHACDARCAGMCIVESRRPFVRVCLSVRLSVCECALKFFIISQFDTQFALTQTGRWTKEASTQRNEIVAGFLFGVYGAAVATQPLQ